MEISYEDFKKIEMKVGKIVDVQEIPGAKNLYKLIVDFGTERRQAISGIKNFYKKEDLIGKKFVFVTNLERKKFFGEESQCMILAAEDENGNIALIKPDKEIKEGSKVR
ncbi:MAG: methionine--tRNA ligase subunit beta [Candidatus Aenigmatarchaeota archaeon]